MGILIASTRFHFAQPVWLASAILIAPLAWMAWRNLAALGAVRRGLAIALRALGVALLAALLGRPMLSRTHERVSTVAIFDRSQSIPQPRLQDAEAFLAGALAPADRLNRLGVVYVAQAAAIAQMPSGLPHGKKEFKLPPGNLGVLRDQTNLADAVQLATAIAPPDTAVRLLLISDGNETIGDLLEAARTAAANGVPIDVRPIRYHHQREVVFSRLAVPPRARANETINLRLVLHSTVEARGRVILNVNGEPMPLEESSTRLTLRPGPNVKVVSLPLGTRGVHGFEARFLPAGASDDTLAENNVATAVTFVAGPGHVLVVAADEARAEPVRQAARKAGIEARYYPPGELPTELPDMLATDAVVIVDTPNGDFSVAQQEMLVRYVKDLGGGLIMTGGPDSYGAGGWIGSPVADILPVDLDPPQKKEMPKGALALIMHACEMPQGNHWGKETAIAAVKSLSRLDLVGVLDYSWSGNAANGHWVFPLGPVGDKSAPISAIKRMEMGDMPDFGPPLRDAHGALSKASAGQKHVIIISDGDPQPPGDQLLGLLRQARITVTCVAVFPHSGQSVMPFKRIADVTGGRFYQPANPNSLPRIFIKEAQIVRRSLIVEKEFSPRLSDPLSEIIRGLGSLPRLDGYVLTGPKGGASRVVLTSDEADPVLSAGQAGLGRCVAFTSAVDGRWGAKWLAWGGFDSFCQQMLRWAGKPAQTTDCEIYTDVEGRRVTVTVEAAEQNGKPVALDDLVAQTIAPDMSSAPLTLEQVGPGRFRGSALVGQSGSYLVNLRYRKGGADAAVSAAQSVVTVPFAPEYRDLTHNMPLLDRVAQITGGRVLPESPEGVDLFSRAGLKFPVTSRPLNHWLMLAWLAVFWLDVAVRRVALDVRAMSRRVRGWFARSGKSEQSRQVLRQLRTRRQAVRGELDERAARETRRQSEARYQADQTAETPELRMAETTMPPKRPATPPATSAAPADQDSHLNRLLKAKRTARSRMDDKPNDQTPSEGA